jgi:hypothetical protein
VERSRDDRVDGGRVVELRDHGRGDRLRHGDPPRREAAAITFVVTAAGVGFLGIGSAFWGLLSGAGMTLLPRRRRAPAEPADVRST